MLTLVLLCGGGTHAVGQVKDAQPVQTQNPGTEVADPTELLGDTPMTRSTLAPLLGSPQAIVLDTAEPFANSATAADSSQTSDATRDQFNADSIRNLRKPISDIRIVAVDAADAPNNLASRFMVKKPVLKVVAAGISPPLPDRYPIALRHRPLYYEQSQLERCGRGYGIAQNAISSGQFYLNTFLLPYHMCKTKPACPVASGGDCLSCEPHSLNCNVLPLSYKGMATEAAALAGFTFLLF